METTQRGRYQVGQEMFTSLGYRAPAANPDTGQREEWGYFADDRDAGFIFRRDEDGFHLVIRRDGADQLVVDQADFNNDKLDGTGPSGATIDFSEGNIFGIETNLYGYPKSVSFMVNARWADGEERPTIMHRADNPVSKAIIPDFNLPVRAEVDNNGSTTSRTIQCTSFNYAVIGKRRPTIRVNSGFGEATLSTADFVDVVSFRHKTGRANVDIVAAGVSVATEQTSLIRLKIGTSLQGANFVTPDGFSDANESAGEIDTSATASSGGNKIWEGLQKASGTGSARSGSGSVEFPRFDIAAGDIATLQIKSLGGSGTAKAIIRWTEEW